MQTVTATFNTAGDGYWSEVSKAVRVTGIDLGYVADDKDFGELCVYFNTDDWDVREDGLIYTDSNFLAELNAFLAAQGLAEADYSEQGMQGDDYVSLDVDGDFIAAWEKKYGYESFKEVHVVD
jgi:hypothetical protein